MSPSKSFRIEKEKKYVHAVAFKLDDEGLFKLDDSFGRLKVRGKRRSDRMRDFIAKVHTLIEEHAKLLQDSEETLGLLKKQEMTISSLRQQLEKLSQVERENRALKQDLAQVTKEKEEPAPEAPRAPDTQKSQAPAVKSQPSPPSMRQVTLAERAEIREIPRKEEPAEESPKPKESKLELIWCPYKEEWISPVKCGQCQTLRFNIFRDCRETRLKNPNDPIFQPSKPMPLV